MDRGWMYDALRWSPLFLNGVSNFLKKKTEFDMRRKKSLDIFCPCLDCRNKRKFRNSMHIKERVSWKGILDGSSTEKMRIPRYL